MHKIPLADNEREHPNECTEVERPLLVQLEAMGWQCVRSDLDYPQKTFRERFRDVILMDKLRDAVRRINRDDDGNPYLDNVTIDRAIRARGHQLSKVLWYEAVGFCQALFPTSKP